MLAKHVFVVCRRVEISLQHLAIDLNPVLTLIARAVLRQVLVHSIQVNAEDILLVVSQYLLKIDVCVGLVIWVW